jgi:hypothetical protein
VIPFWIRADLEEAAFRGDELSRLGSAALAVVQKENLIKRGEDLRMVECDACGSPHIEEVDIITDSPDGVPRAYIPCEYTGRRVSVPLDRLQVWAIDFERLCRLVAAALGISGRATQLAEDRVWMLGTGRFLDRTRDVFLVRGIGWPGSGSLLENNQRLATSPCPLILCMNRVPESPAWFSAERVVLSLSEFDWLENDQSTLLKDVNDLLREHPRPPDQAQHVFRREGDFWSVTFEGKTIRIKDGKGAQYLAYLLSQPGRDFPAVELLHAVSGADAVAVRGSAGETIDEQARAQYKARALEIQEELNEARARYDSGRVEALQQELEQLADQMTSATGLGGRRRLVGDTSEKARKSVSAAISRTVRQIAAANKVLGGHLKNQLSLGASISYRGDGTPWNF